MGYQVSTIKNLPTLSGYYFFLTGRNMSWSKMTGTSKVLYGQFDIIAKEIGPDSSLIQSLDVRRTTDELIASFETAPWFNEINYKLLRHEPALIIMRPHPAVFDFSKDSFFLYIPFKTLDAVYSTEYELVSDIVEFAVNGDTSLIDKITTIPKQKRRDALIFQPNIYGFGVDLKKLLSKNGEKPFSYHTNSKDTSSE